MKKYVICNYLDYVHTADVESDDDGVITLNSGASFTRISSKSKIVYQSDTETPSAGAILKEVVTVVADVADVSDLFNRKENYILRLYNAGEIIIVGSQNYPVRKIYSDNKVTATITFTRQSAL